MKKSNYIGYFYFCFNVLCLLLLSGCSFQSQNLDKEIYCIGVGNSTFDTELRMYLLQDKFDYGLDAEDVSRAPNHLLPKEIQETLNTIILYFRDIIQGVYSPNMGVLQSAEAISANDTYNYCMQNIPNTAVKDEYDTIINNNVIKNKSLNEQLFCMGFANGEAWYWLGIRRAFIDLVNSYGDSPIIDGNTSDKFIDDYASELTSEESISKSFTRCIEYIDNVGEELMTTKLWLYSK